MGLKLKLKISRLTKNLIYYPILIIISFLLLFPLLYMITNSFMGTCEVMSAYGVLQDPAIAADNAVITEMNFKFIPDQVSFMQYYNILLRKPKFLVMFWNSIILTIPIMLGQMFVAALAAFSFSKLRFPFRNKIFFIYIIVMMMPFQVTLVPNYIILKQMNLIGSFWSVILPGIFTTFGVFLLRQFMLFIPDEYCEAGKIDGAGFISVFARIILPQCKGALASLAILVFVDNWNMVEQPLIFLKDQNMHPMSIFLSSINSSELGLAFACGVLYMLPSLLIFLYGENYFIEGIQLSGIK